MGALDGILILDLTRLLPGAFCSQMLADLGARVIKVEQPGRGDYNRDFAPRARHESGSFLLLNRNKESLTLNLKSEEGTSIFRRLAARADVVLEGFRPGVMGRLGVGYETLRKGNPKLVYCAISGFGQDGPYARVAGHDLNYMAIAGALQLFGKAGDGPIVPGLSIADVGGGSLMAAVGILAALRSRDRTGEGQFVDVSMTDGAVAWLAYHGADTLFAGVEPRGGERPFLGEAACYNVYRCRDGRHLTVGCIESEFWARFCSAAGLEDEVGDQWPTGKAAKAQRERVARRLAERDCAEWIALMQERDVPVARSNTIAEAFGDPQLEHRGMLQWIDHPREGRIPQLGFPVKLSGTPATMRAPPPMLGEHTTAILRDLGVESDAVDRLREEGVV